MKVNNKPKRKISVIVTTHNRFAYVVEAIRSIIVQAEAPFEICIVDDGSLVPVQQQWEDEHPFETEIPLHFVRIEDRGPAAARNAGANIATGDFYAFLDDDDQMEAMYLTEALRKIEIENADVCVTWLRCFDNISEWPGKHFPVDHLTSNPYERNIGFVGSNIIISSRIYQEINGFDSDLLGSEDKDLYIRLRAANACFTVLEKELIRYRIHSLEQASGQFRFHPFQVSGKYLFLKKHAQNIPKDTYRKLAGDAGFFRLMGGRNFGDRFDGFISILRYDIRKIFLVVCLVVRKATSL